MWLIPSMCEALSSILGPKIPSPQPSPHSTASCSSHNNKNKTKTKTPAASERSRMVITWLGLTSGLEVHLVIMLRQFQGVGPWPGLSVLLPFSLKRHKRNWMTQLKRSVESVEIILKNPNGCWGCWWGRSNKQRGQEAAKDSQELSAMLAGGSLQFPQCPQSPLSGPALPQYRMGCPGLYSWWIFVWSSSFGQGKATSVTFCRGD